MSERQADPDEREDRDCHRPGHVGQRWTQQRKDQHHRDGRDEDEEDLERGSEVGGGDHAQGAEEGRGFERPGTRGHPEELDLRAPGEPDHRHREDRTSGGDDDDREDDPGDRPEDPGHRFRTAPAAAAGTGRPPARCGSGRPLLARGGIARRRGDGLLLAGLVGRLRLRLERERRLLRWALPPRPRRTWSRGKVHCLRAYPRMAERRHRAARPCRREATAVAGCRSPTVTPGPRSGAGATRTPATPPRARHDRSPARGRR